VATTTTVVILPSVLPFVGDDPNPVPLIAMNSSESRDELIIIQLDVLRLRFAIALEAIVLSIAFLEDGAGFLDIFVGKRRGERARMTARFDDTGRDFLAAAGTRE